jgi:hypothetical protein
VSRPPARSTAVARSIWLAMFAVDLLRGLRRRRGDSVDGAGGLGRRLCRDLADVLDRLAEDLNLALGVLGVDLDADVQVAD